MRLARQDRGEAFLYELLAHPIDHRRARLQLFDDLAVAQAFARLGNVRRNALDALCGFQLQRPVDRAGLRFSELVLSDQDFGEFYLRRRIVRHALRRRADMWRWIVSGSACGRSRIALAFFHENARQQLQLQPCRRICRRWRCASRDRGLVITPLDVR